MNKHSLYDKNDRNSPFAPFASSLFHLDFVELLDTFFKTSASPQGPLGFAACQSKSFGWF
jgi:hypothetical protein